MDLNSDIDMEELKHRISDLSRQQKVEFASWGVGGFILITAFIIYLHGSAALKPIAGSLFVAGILIAFLPYGLYIYFRDRAIRQMENEFPAFIRNVSESIKSGMSLPEAFRHATNTDYGRLDPIVRKAAHQLSWGIPFPEVMERLSDQLERSGLMRRATYIILQSYESGGNISETLDAIAANASRIREAEKQKKAVLMQQVYIIYAIHFLFLGIIIALYMLLGSFLLKMGGSSSAAIAGFGQVTNFCNTALGGPVCGLCPLFGLGTPGQKICYYKGLFLMMLTMGGIVNGFVAGEVLEGKLSAGVKHGLVMTPLGIIIYIVAINML